MWKPISGYEGLYEVSDAGEVRSLDRTIQCSNGAVKFLRAKDRKLSPDKDGYLQCTLSRGKRYRSIYEHSS